MNHVLQAIHYLGSMLSNDPEMRPVRIWWLTVSLFSVAFMACGYFNRLASDDLEFYRVFSEKGIAEATLFFRDTWNTRWVSILWLNCWFTVFTKTGSLLPFHLATLAALVLSAGYFISALLKPLRFTRASVGLFAGCTAAALFYASFSIPDTWYWANTATMYGWSHVYAFMAAGVMLSARFTAREALILAIAAFGIGGGNEPFAVSVILFSICAVAVSFIPALGLKIPARKNLIFLTLTLTAFLISYTGDGHTVRSSLLPDLSFAGKIWVLIKSLVKLFILYIPEKIPALLLLLAPFFYAGTLYSGNINSGKVLRIATISFIALCVLSLMPVVWLMSEMGPERSWSQISLYLTAFTGFALFVTGYQYRLRFNAMRILRIIGMLSVIFVAATGVKAVIISEKYSEQWDRRMSYLNQLKRSQVSETDTIVLPPLPSAGWLHSGEIETYPGHFTNRHLQEYAGLKNPIIVKKEKE